MKKTHKIPLPPKQGGWNLGSDDLVHTIGRLGHFKFYIEGELPHPQSLCIEYDDGVED